MIWGVNIHRSYANLPPGDVLALAKAMGFTSIRVDVYEANTDTKTYLAGLIAAATPLGLGIVPVLAKPKASALGSEQACFNWSYQTARSLALWFPQMTWEAGNELDMDAIKPGTSGEVQGDYDNRIFGLARAAIRGMYQGFKSASAMPVGVGMAGVHWGFLDRLKASGGVTWDITTWHYYTPVGTPAPDINAGAKQYLDRLATYNKPLALTEINQQSGHLSTADPQTLIDTMAAIANWSGTQTILAAYLYELLDEPHLSGGEATYGLCNATGVPNALGEAARQHITAGA